MRLPSGVIFLYLAANHAISMPILRSTTEPSIGSGSTASISETGSILDRSTVDSSPDVAKRETSTGVGDNTGESEPEDDDGNDKPTLIEEIAFMVTILGQRDVRAIVNELSQKHSDHKAKIQRMVYEVIAMDEIRLGADIPSADEGKALIDYSIFSDPELREYVDWASTSYLSLGENERNVRSLTRMMRGYFETIPQEQKIMQTVIAYFNAARTIRQQMRSRVYDNLPTDYVVSQLVERTGLLDREWVLNRVAMYYDSKFLLAIKRYHNGPEFRWPKVKPEDAKWI